MTGVAAEELQSREHARSHRHTTGNKQTKTILHVALVTESVVATILLSAQILT